MPKMKTRKVAVKRFRVTKNGKVLHRMQGQRHLRRKKSKSKQREFGKMAEITNTSYKKMIRTATGKM